MGKFAAPLFLFVCAVTACTAASSTPPAAHAGSSPGPSIEFSEPWTAPRLIRAADSTETGPNIPRLLVDDGEIEVAWLPRSNGSNEAQEISERPSAAHVWAHSSGVGDPWVLRPGRSSDDRFVWSTVVNAAERRILIGVSTWGTIHGKDVSVGPREGASFDMVPVLDLFTVPEGASNIQAAASQSELALLWSTSRGVYLHRMSLPPASPETQHLRVRDVGMPQSVLVNGPLFAEVASSPVGVSSAVQYRNATPDCVHPVSMSVATNEPTYVLPSMQRMRMARAVSGGWEIHEYALKPAILGALHATLVPPAGWSLETSSSCRDRGVVYSRPEDVRRWQVATPDNARWVGTTDTAAYLATSDAVLRVVWGEVEGPIRVEEAAVLPSGVDTTTIRIQGHRLGFGIPEEDIAVVGHRLHADDGAFALAGDAVVVVRREGYLHDGAHSLVPTDSLPLAAAVRANGTLVVALQTPRGALVVADVTRDGELHMATMVTCIEGYARAAAFVDVDLLLIGCDGPRAP